MENKNYNDFDTLKLYVKKNKVDDLKKSYSCFGYELTSESPNNKYEDIVDLEFERPHKISNKDELQLLQVYMEENVNKLAKTEKNKHSKSTIFGLIFGPLCLAFVLFGAYLVLKVQTPLGLIFGVVSIILGIAVGIVTTIVSIEISKKEKITFEEIKNQLNSNTSEICAKAKKLLGGQNAKNK